MKDVLGTVYLIHFHEPYKHARHYIGWTSDLAAREAEHQAGRGSRLLAVVREAGIGFRVVRTWQGTRKQEHSRKNWPGGSKLLCPICNPSNLPYTPSAEKCLLTMLQRMQ